ncbi:MAG: peptidylprolyl isomerase [Burkholderiaceae bacterium]|nr:peptidylprolyl isomerase [Burkholderiaceae bacterium]
MSTVTTQASRAKARLSVNGVELDASGASPAELRERALNELLRQAALERGLLGQGQAAETAPEAFAAAVDALVEAQVPRQVPDDAECRRYFDANPARFAQGERVKASHILFAVTPGVPVVALRQRAEQALLDVRTAPQTFAGQARKLSNCPSAAEGGDLGWLEAGRAVPEFEAEVLRHAEVGVLPRLVHTRYGLHVVRVEAREPGVVPDFEESRGAVRATLERENQVTAMRHFIQRLAARARIEGVDLGAVGPPLAQ